MWWELFSQVFKLPMLVLRKAMLNPMGIFIYGILAKWYVIIAVAAVAVTYWVFKGLEQTGVLSAVELKVREGLWDAQAVAKHCVPKILNLNEMWDCISHLPAYQPSSDETDLNKQLQDAAMSTIPQAPSKDSSSSASSTSSTNPFDSTQDYNPYNNDLASD